MARHLDRCAQLQHHRGYHFCSGCHTGMRVCITFHACMGAGGHTSTMHMRQLKEWTPRGWLTKQIVQRMYATPVYPGMHRMHPASSWPGCYPSLATQSPPSTHRARVGGRLNAIASNPLADNSITNSVLQQPQAPPSRGQGRGSSIHSRGGAGQLQGWCCGGLCGCSHR
jgi:hypothetical protein